MYTSELWIKQSTHTPAPKWVKAKQYTFEVYFMKWWKKTSIKK